MKLTRDIYDQIEIPEILLASPSKNIQGCISNFKELRIVLNLNDVDSVSFKVYRNRKQELNEAYNNLEDLKLILVKGYGWFQINVTLESDGLTEYKMITGQSLEVELGQQYLVDIHINTSNILYDDYEPVKFYTPIKPSVSLLHKAIATAPNWSIGHVDMSLWEMQRSFDVDEQDIYSFLTSDVANAFKCMFLFDSFNRTINAYVVEDYGDNTCVYIDFENVMSSLNITADVNSIKTCFRIEGGEGVNVNEVNPAGTNMIYNPGYYLSWMTDETRNSFEKYKIVYDGCIDEYKYLMSQYRTLIDELIELNDKVAADINSADLTLFGLTELQTKEKSYINIESVYIEKGFGAPSNPNYQIYYLPNHHLLLEVQAELLVRTAQIEHKESEIQYISEQKSNINNTLKIESFFTDEQWKEFMSYRREYTYRNDNFIITDSTSDQEIISIEQELYDLAVTELEKVCEPKYSFSSNLKNLFAIKAFDVINDDIELGNFIQVEVRPDYIARLRLISIGLNFDALNELEVTFSDMTRARNCYDDTAEVLAQASSASTTLGIYISQMLKDCDKASSVHKIMQDGLNAANTMISNADSQDIVLNEFGIWLRKYNKELLGYEPEQIRMINNLICFSDDGFRSTQLALGKICVNGIWTYGLLAPAIVGKLLMTETLYIGNVNNTFTIDKNGLVSLNADKTLAICLNPNNTDGLIEIVKNYKLKNEKRIFYTDANGNLHITGHIDAASITLSDCEGITINNGNGTFLVDADGNLFSKSGEIGGFRITDKELISKIESEANYIRLSPICTRSGEPKSSIDLGLEKDGVNSLIHFRGDGYARIGLATQDGSIRFNLDADDFLGGSRRFNFYTKNFRIASDGLVTSTGITLKNASAIKGYDTTASGDVKGHDLVKYSDEDNVVVGEKADPQNVHIYSKDDFAVYMGPTNERILILDGTKIQLKNDVVINKKLEVNNTITQNGVAVATKTDLDRLEGEYLQEIDYWKSEASKWKSMYDSEKAYADGWRGHNCPVCTRPHADE